MSSPENPTPTPLVRCGGCSKPPAAGETLRVRLRSTTSYADGTNVKWTLAVLDAKDKERLRQSLDLNKGFLP